MKVIGENLSSIGDAGPFVPKSGQDPHRRRIPISWSIVSGIWVLMDSIAILGSGAASYAMYLGWSEWNLGVYVGAIFFVWVSALVFSQLVGLTEPDAVLSPFQVLDRIVIVGAISFLFLVALAFSLKVSETFSRVWVFSFGISSAAAVISLRVAGASILGRLARSGLLSRRVVIFGVNEQAERFVSQFRAGAKGLSRVEGIFDDHVSRAGADVSGVPVKGGFADLISAIRRGEVDDVVVALPWHAENYIAEIIGHLRELPVNIYLAFDLVAYRYRLRASPSHFADLKLVEVVDAPLSGWKAVLKAAEDRILAAIFLVLFAPAFLLIYLAVRIETPGPAFFKQTRYGFNNKKFVIFKFRSMKHVEDEDAAITVQAVRNDPRVTRVGRFLRRTSLDELPQLFNVLNGTMSLVGPRPHAVDHNEEYSKLIHGYFARHNVKPGITGLAQTNGLRGETDTVEKMKERVGYDIFYTEHWSVWLDLRILFKTAYIVWASKNAY